MTADTTDDDAPPTERRPLSGCARLSLGCLVLLLLLGGGAAWAIVSHRRRLDEEFATAVRRVLDPAPLTFDRHGRAEVLVHQGVGQSFEVERADQARVVAALAPLGAVRRVTLLEVGDRAPGQLAPVRCRVEGERASADVTFQFEPRDLPLHVWWGLRSATLER